VAQGALEELRAWQSRLGEFPPEAPEHDPRRFVAKTITYLENNQGRMNYRSIAARDAGDDGVDGIAGQGDQPTTKGTEMFWNDPEEPRRSCRSCRALCDDNRLNGPPEKRAPATPSTRRPKTPIQPAQKSKADVHPSELGVE